MENIEITQRYQIHSIELIQINTTTRAKECSATSSSKRFVANLTDYTIQTSGFDISAVDRIHLYIYSDVEKSMTFWIDDLTVDASIALEKAIYKGRGSS